MNTTLEDLEMARMYVGTEKKRGLSFEVIARERNRDPRTVARRVKIALNKALDLYGIVQDTKR